MASGRSEPTAEQLAIAVGDVLRRMRERALMTQQAVAIAIGTHRPIVGRTERGAGGVPSLESCERWAAACGGSVLEVTRVVDRLYGLDRLALVA